MDEAQRREGGFGGARAGCRWWSVLALVLVGLLVPRHLAAEPPPALEDCRARLTAAPTERATARCFFELASGEGDAAEAVRTLERLSAARSDLPWFTFYLGNLRWPRSEEAEELAGRAASSFARAGDEEGEVLARINRSQLLIRLGRPAEARREMDRVIAITEASEDPGMQAWGRIILARRLYDDGTDLARAYEILRTTEIPPGVSNEFSLRRDRLITLGLVCMAIGRYGEGREAYRTVAEMARRAGDPYLEANTRYNLAIFSFERLRETPTPGQRAEVVTLTRDALAVARESGHRTIEALAAAMLGMLLPGAEGRPYLERCLEIAEAGDVQSYCLNHLASHVAATEPERARRLLRSSRELAERSGGGWAEVRVWQEGLRVRWAMEPPDEALASSWEALDAIETLRDAQAEGSSVQAGVFSVWSDEYAWLAGRILQEAGKGLTPERAAAEAFRVDERMRARALTDWLRRAGSEAGAGEGAGFSGLDEVRAALEPHEALLSFQVAPWEDLSGGFGGGSWLLAVTRAGVSVHRLPGRVKLRRDVRLFEGLIERRDGSEAGPAAHLYRTLLEPAVAGLPPEVDRLVLVPDDTLHRLPFAALRPSVDAEPLGARYELVQVPSATLWLHWRREGRAEPSRPLLVLADPDVPTTEGAPEGAPDPVGAETALEIAQVRDAAEGLGRLPHARREGRAAVRALGGGLLLTGPDASEEALRGLPLRDFGVVHFAAHAVTDEARPERSAVVLARAGADDGFLRSAEIAGLDLAGRTVALASCRSASGSVLRGEGVMSLARAFFQAGAHGVVASLWPLRDDESEVMFGRFYRRLAGGATVSGAVRDARRAAIAAGEPAAAWAGLVVLGDGAQVPVPRTPSGGAVPRWAALAGVLLLLAVAAGLVIRYTRLRN